MIVTTLEQARAMNLDVFLLPPHRRDLIENLSSAFVGSGREVIEFEVEIAHFKLTVVAVEPRKGVIAEDMKKRKKTPMEFIQAE